MGARVVIMAGGTGGHVYPALAVAEELRSRGCELVWMGTQRGLESRVVPSAGFTLETLSVAGLRGKNWRERVTGPFLLLKSCLQAIGILRRHRPQVVLGFGGFVSGPGGLMSRLLGVPLVIHEQNCIPGTTNRWLAKSARRVLEAFPGSFPKERQAECTGNPVRRALLEIAAQRASRLPDAPLRIFVFGGSLGAQALNEIVPEALAQLNLPCEIRHQTGTAMRDQTAALYRRLGVASEVVAFIDDMASAYRWADLAVCRSGAMTVSELAVVGLPAILVPYPYAIDDHQTANARFFEKGGAGRCVPQNDLTAAGLAALIRELAADPETLVAMGRQASNLAKPQAAQRVADIALKEAR
ncbi:undecaprenyldiphospho-muramoylpentapeptide beta-N-acetylglucosaminyltransferase [Methylolobus aquaticus]|nr:undecaprenyldiphospho-muramoylpentapeptide beta-N-acetylglucosaminyltransferase [Methylolobus aquaticus]